jgi:serine/threonine protein phosphatase PrpC
LNIRSCGITDVGLKRDGNEDAFAVEDSLGLYIVADGMGGHLAGEVASRVAVEMINGAFRKWIEEEASEQEIFGEPDASLSLVGNYLLGAIRLANSVVYEMALEQKHYQGMGTTVAALFVTPTMIISANVGDSRIYLMRDGDLERLSRDHSLVGEQIEMGMMTEEEADSSSIKHVLTRNLGSSEDVEPDIFEIEPSDNDCFVLCSDGVTDLLNDGEILGLSMEASAPEDLCKKIMDTVLKRGAHDNTTIISLFLTDIKKRHVSVFKKIGLPISEIFGVAMRAFKKIVS